MGNKASMVTSTVGYYFVLLIKYILYLHSCSMTKLELLLEVECTVDSISKQFMLECIETCWHWEQTAL